MISHRAALALSFKSGLLQFPNLRLATVGPAPKHGVRSPVATQRTIYQWAGLRASRGERRVQLVVAFTLRVACPARPRVAFERRERDDFLDATVSTAAGLANSIATQLANAKTVLSVRDFVCWTPDSTSRTILPLAEERATMHAFAENPESSMSAEFGLCRRIEAGVPRLVLPRAGPQVKGVLQQMAAASKGRRPWRLASSVALRTPLASRSSSSKAANSLLPSVNALLANLEKAAPKRRASIPCTNRVQQRKRGEIQGQFPTRVTASTLTLV